MKRLFAFLRSLPRRLALTETELGLVAERADIIADIRALGERQVRLAKQDRVAHMIVEALRAPQRFMPDVALTADEAKSWGAMMTGPLGVKIDTAVLNFCQQQAAAAVAAPADQLAHSAGVARGCLIGWQLAKTLSVLSNTDVGTHETDPDTARAGLEHHQP